MGVVFICKRMDGRRDCIDGLDGIAGGGREGVPRRALLAARWRGVNMASLAGGGCGRRDAAGGGACRFTSSDGDRPAASEPFSLPPNSPDTRPHLHRQQLHMDLPPLQRFSPPGVTLLVAFLALTSQWLFHYIEPGPLRKGDAYLFNAMVTCLLICYWRTCFTDPGRIPKDWQERVHSAESGPPQSAAEGATQTNRWCRRCEAFKPPRAHHCKTCKR